jgi:transcriptional regulator with XRE-family HTH domain
MGTRKRVVLDHQAHRLLAAQMLEAGSRLRKARRRRRWTQAQLGAKCGLSQSTVSDAEIGRGAELSETAWQRLALVLGLPLKFELGRDALEEPADAGHLAIEELVLRLGRASGRRRRFELATKPSEPSRSTDVGLIDDRQCALILTECVNTFGNINASIRSSDRKRVEAEAVAMVLGGDAPYRVATCWVVRATRRNRQLLARYPELFASRFPGSSRAWVSALAAGAEPPAQPGLVWCDVSATRLFEWRARVAA